jgi:hypothetical protein
MGLGVRIVQGPKDVQKGAKPCDHVCDKEERPSALIDSPLLRYRLRGAMLSRRRMQA